MDLPHERAAACALSVGTPGVYGPSAKVFVLASHCGRSVIGIGMVLTSGGAVRCVLQGAHAGLRRRSEERAALMRFWASSHRPRKKAHSAVIAAL